MTTTPDPCPEDWLAEEFAATGLEWRDLPDSARPVVVGDPAEHQPVVTSVLDLGMISHKPTRDALRQAAAGAKYGPVWILNRNGKRIGAIVSVEAAEAGASEEA